MHLHLHTYMHVCVSSLSSFGAALLLPGSRRHPMTPGWRQQLISTAACAVPYTSHVVCRMSSKWERGCVALMPLIEQHTSAPHKPQHNTPTHFLPQISVPSTYPPLAPHLQHTHQQTYSQTFLSPTLTFLRSIPLSLSLFLSHSLSLFLFR